MAEGGVMRACVAAIMGVALAIAGPYAFVGVEATWQKIVLLSLVLACVAILVTTIVLSMVAEMCARSGSHAEKRVVLLSDVFLFSGAVMMLVTFVFAFVFAIVRMA